MVPRTGCLGVKFTNRNRGNFENVEGVQTLFLKTNIKKTMKRYLPEGVKKPESNGLHSSFKVQKNGQKIPPSHMKTFEPTVQSGIENIRLHTK